MANDDAVLKVLCQGLKRMAKRSTMPPRSWKKAFSQFVMLFGDRIHVVYSMFPLNLTKRVKGLEGQENVFWAKDLDARTQLSENK